jgi:hypothetical protein
MNLFIAIAYGAIVFFLYHSYLDVNFWASMFAAVVFYFYVIANMNLNSMGGPQKDIEFMIELIGVCIAIAGAASIFIFYYFYLGVHFLASLLPAVTFYLWVRANILCNEYIR